VLSLQKIMGGHMGGWSKTNWGPVPPPTQHGPKTATTPRIHTCWPLHVVCTVGLPYWQRGFLLTLINRYSPLVTLWSAFGIDGWRLAFSQLLSHQYVSHPTGAKIQMGKIVKQKKKWIKRSKIKQNQLLKTRSHHFVMYPTCHNASKLQKHVKLKL